MNPVRPVILWLLACLFWSQLSWATPAQEEIIGHFLHAQMQGPDHPDTAALESALTLILTDVIGYIQLPVVDMTLPRFETSIRVLQPMIAGSKTTPALYVSHLSLRKFGGILFLDGYLESNPENTRWGMLSVRTHKIYLDLSLFYTDIPQQVQTVRNLSLELLLDHPQWALVFKFPHFPLPTESEGASAFFQSSFSYQPNTHSVVTSKVFDVIPHRNDPKLLSFLSGGSDAHDLINGANPDILPLEEPLLSHYEQERAQGIVPIVVLEAEGLDYNHPDLQPLLFYTHPRQETLTLADQTNPLLGIDYTEGDFLPFAPSFVFVKPEFRGSSLTQFDTQFSHAEIVVRIIGKTPRLKSFLFAGGQNLVLDQLQSVSPLRRQNVAQHQNERIRKGITLAIAQGAKVVNGSMASATGTHFGNSSEEKNEIREELNFWTSLFLEHPDVLFIFAAGNDPVSLDASSRPYDYYLRPIPQRFGGTFENVLVVGACHPLPEQPSNVVLDDYSSYGPQTVQICTQGTYELPIAWQERDSLTLTGTSLAVPRITRRIGEFLLANPKLTGVEAKALLFQEAKHIPALSDKIQEGRFIDLP